MYKLSLTQRVSHDASRGGDMALRIGDNTSCI
jgi:hypothetical protein